MENTFTDVRVQRVAIASSKHKVSHSATLCFSSFHTQVPVVPSLSNQILLHVLALGSCLIIVFVGEL